MVTPQRSGGNSERADSVDDGCPADPRELTEIAHDYRKWGFSVIPLERTTDGFNKKPAWAWKRFQETLPTHRQLGKMVDWVCVVGLGVIFGPVSGGLIARDFDSVEAYEIWASENEEIAAECPTIVTPRPGRVVLCRQRPTKNFAHHVYPDAPQSAGELRRFRSFSCFPPTWRNWWRDADQRWQPPSRYRWLGAAPSRRRDFPLLDIRATGFLTEIPTLPSTPANGGEKKDSNGRTPQTDDRES